MLKISYAIGLVIAHCVASAAMGQAGAEATRCGLVELPLSVQDVRRAIEAALPDNDAEREIVIAAYQQCANTIAPMANQFAALRGSWGDKSLNTVRREVYNIRQRVMHEFQLFASSVSADWTEGERVIWQNVLREALSEKVNRRMPHWMGLRRIPDIRSVLSSASVDIADHKDIVNAMDRYHDEKYYQMLEWLKVEPAQCEIIYFLTDTIPDGTARADRIVEEFLPVCRAIDTIRILTWNAIDHICMILEIDASREVRRRALSVEYPILMRSTPVDGFVALACHDVLARNEDVAADIKLTVAQFQARRESMVQELVREIRYSPKADPRSVDANRFRKFGREMALAQRSAISQISTLVQETCAEIQRHLEHHEIDDECRLAKLLLMDTGHALEWKRD